MCVRTVPVHKMSGEWPRKAEQATGNPDSKDLPVCGYSFFSSKMFFLPAGFPENFPAKIYLPNFQNTVLGKISPEYPMLL